MQQVIEPTQVAINIHTHVVFMGMDLGCPSGDRTAYWKYNGERFIEISKEEYEECQTRT